MRAVVVFCNTEHSLSWMLKEGFRHCFVCLASNGLWIQVDAKHGIPYVHYLTTDDFDLAGFYRDQGLTVIETEQRQHAVTWPLVIRNCVGLVTSVLCIERWLVTPYGLYKYLRKHPCN